MGLNVNTVPIQGTFDIARGRNVLRNQLAAYHWPPTLWARGAALLTAMGELILSTQTTHAVPLEMAIVTEQREIWMRCTVSLDNVSSEMLSTLEERIQRAADHADVNRQLNQVCVMAHLYATKGA